MAHRGYLLEEPPAPLSRRQPVRDEDAKKKAKKAERSRSRSKKKDKEKAKHKERSRSREESRKKDRKEARSASASSESSEERKRKHEKEKARETKEHKAGLPWAWHSIKRHGSPPCRVPSGSGSKNSPPEDVKAGGATSRRTGSARKRCFKLHIGIIRSHPTMRQASNQARYRARARESMFCLGLTWHRTC